MVFKYFKQGVEIIYIFYGILKENIKIQKNWFINKIKLQKKI